MGVDLRLLPLMSNHGWLSHEIYSVERRRELWEDIAGLSQEPIPQPLGCFLAHDPKTGDTCYGDVEETPYGERITYTTAADLLSLKDHEAVKDNWRNRSIWAALAEMPPDWKIALYWY